MTEEAKMYSGEGTVSAIDGVGEAGLWHAEE